MLTPWSLPSPRRPALLADLSRAPGLKCRAGRAVEFKNTSGKAVSALLEITERSTDAGNLFNVKVAPVQVWWRCSGWRAGTVGTAGGARSGWRGT